MAENLREFGFYVEGVLLMVVGCLGCVGNCLCILTFSRMVLQKNFHRLMLALAAFDLLYISCSMVLFGLPGLLPWLYSTSIFRRTIIILLPMGYIGLTGSIYLTVAIALERYTTVCHPFFKITHAWSSWTYIVPISIFSLLYNVPKFLELEVNTRLANVTQNGSSGNQTIVVEQLVEVVDPTNLRIDPYYIQIYIIYMNLFIHGIIPLLLLVALNVCIYRQLRIYHRSLENAVGRVSLQQKEVRLSQVSLAIVMVFILCHSIRWIPNIWELKQAGVKKGELVWPAWVQYVTHLSHLLTVLNSSVNFFIYLCKHPSLFLGMLRSVSANALNGMTDVTILPASKKVSTCPVNQTIILNKHHQVELLDCTTSV